MRGTGPPAREGHVFDGTDDGELCDLPTAEGQFASSIPEPSRNGCFQGQTEFDEVNDTFDERTRRAQFARTSSATAARLAGRGVSLNDTIAELPRLFRNLEPVARALSDREVNLSRFIRGLWRYTQYAAPAAREQAQFFGFAAIAFRAISSNPEALKDAISEAPLTYETGIRLLPDQRVFLAERRAVRAPHAARRRGPARHAAGASTTRSRRALRYCASHPRSTGFCARR